MAYSVARMARAPEPFVENENLRHQLAMAKYQARREIDLRVEQKVLQLKQDALRKTRTIELQRVEQLIRRNKDFEVAGYAITFWCGCAYLFGYFATLWLLA
jgi:hypothetical protein